MEANEKMTKKKTEKEKKVTVLGEASGGFY